MKNIIWLFLIIISIILLYLVSEIYFIKFELNNCLTNLKHCNDKNNIILRKNFQNDLNVFANKVKLLNDENLQQFRKITNLSLQPIIKNNNSFTEYNDDSDSQSKLMYFSEDDIKSDIMINKKIDLTKKNINNSNSIDNNFKFNSKPNIIEILDTNILNLDSFTNLQNNISSDKTTIVLNNNLTPVSSSEIAANLAVSSNENNLINNSENITYDETNINTPQLSSEIAANLAVSSNENNLINNSENITYDETNINTPQLPSEIAANLAVSSDGNNLINNSENITYDETNINTPQLPSEIAANSAVSSDGNNSLDLILIKNKKNSINTNFIKDNTLSEVNSAKQIEIESLSISSESDLIENTLLKIAEEKNNNSNNNNSNSNNNINNINDNNEYILDSITIGSKSIVKKQKKQLNTSEIKINKNIEKLEEKKDNIELKKIDEYTLDTLKNIAKKHGISTTSKINENKYKQLNKKELYNIMYNYFNK